MDWQVQMNRQQDQEVHKDFPDHKDQQDRRVNKVQQASAVSRVNKVQQASAVQTDYPVVMDKTEVMVLMEKMATALQWVN